MRKILIPSPSSYIPVPAFDPTDLRLVVDFVDLRFLLPPASCASPAASSKSSERPTPCIQTPITSALKPPPTQSSLRLKHLKGTQGAQGLITATSARILQGDQQHGRGQSRDLRPETVSRGEAQPAEEEGLGFRWREADRESFGWACT